MPNRSILDIWDDMLTGKVSRESNVSDENQGGVSSAGKEDCEKRGACGVGGTWLKCFGPGCANWEDKK